MKEIIEQLTQITDKLADLKKYLELEQKKQQILELESQMSQPDFWNDNERARNVARKLDSLKRLVSQFETLEREVHDGTAVAQSAFEEGDHSLEKDLAEDAKRLEQLLMGLELVIFFSGKYDEQDALITIHAGAGGVDAQDWAQMLQTMYLKYIQEQEWQAEVIQVSRGDEAGIKSVMIEVTGQYAFGYLKHESGVHRLVRLSPYDADHARHTSFAYVEVLPVLAEEQVSIDDKDLRIDTFRSSGPGGQSVNTTDSAVRITHEPTGIVVSVQSERSQLQNKEQAMKILAAKIGQFQAAEAEEERQRLRGEFTEAAWGNQIRSYVLHPYKMVKDHRTNYEEQDVESVLDGQLSGFIENTVRELGKKEGAK